MIRIGSRFIGIILTAFMVVAPSVFAITEDTVVDVTDLVQVEQSRIRYDRRAGTSYLDVTLTNTSDKALLGPVILVIDSITSSSVTVKSPDGTTEEGEPFMTVVGSDVILQAGESSGSKRLSFDNSVRARFGFETEVLSKILLYRDHEASIYGIDPSVDIIVNKYSGPLEQYTDLPIYSIYSDTQINKPLLLKYNQFSPTTESFLKPITFNESKNRFIVDGYMDSPDTISIPHLSLWSSIIENISNITNTETRNHECGDVKGAYIGWELGSSVEKLNNFESLLNDIREKRYNTVYLNRGGIKCKVEIESDKSKICQYNSELTSHLPINKVPEDKISEYQINSELVFGISGNVFDHICKINEVPVSPEDKIKFYKNYFLNDTLNWIEKHSYITSNKVHLNIESEKYISEEAQAATVAILEIFVESGWKVSVSIVDHWSTPYLSKMDNNGAKYFALQLYNLGITTEEKVLTYVDTMRNKLNDAGISTGRLILTMPYYGCDEECSSSYHPSSENITTYNSALRKYIFLEDLGGSYIYDFAYYDASKKLPQGDMYYEHEEHYNAYDELYETCNGHTFFLDDFELDDDQWDIATYEQGGSYVTADPTDATNKVLRIYGTDTGHRIMYHQLSIPKTLSGFQLSVDYFKTSDNHYHPWIGVQADDDLYVFGRTHEDLGNPNFIDSVKMESGIVIKPLDQPIDNSSYDDRSTVWGIGSIPSNTWVKLDLWHESESNRIIYQVTSKDDGSLLYNHSYLIKPVINLDLSGGLLKILIGAEETTEQYFDNVQLQF